MVLLSSSVVFIELTLFSSSEGGILVFTFPLSSLVLDVCFVAAPSVPSAVWAAPVFDLDASTTALSLSASLDECLVDSAFGIISASDFSLISSMKLFTSATLVLAFSWTLGMGFSTASSV